MSKLGAYIKEKRKEKNLTLKELGELINFSHQYLSQLENGKRKPSNHVILKLAKALDSDYRYLRFLNEEYTEEEYNFFKSLDNFVSIYNDLTPEDFERMDKDDTFNYYLDLFQREKYPTLEQLIDDGKLYVNGTHLTKEDGNLLLRIAKAIVEDKEKDYPSEEEIKLEYLNLYEQHKEAKEGDAFFTVGEHNYYRFPDDE